MPLETSSPTGNKKIPLTLKQHALGTLNIVSQSSIGLHALPEKKQKPMGGGGTIVVYSSSSHLEKTPGVTGSVKKGHSFREHPELRSTKFLGDMVNRSRTNMMDVGGHEIAEMAILPKVIVERSRQQSKDRLVN
jgi:hypothetical protein